MSAPSTNGHNGRDDRGRFGKGNPGGPGNPHGRRSAEIRSALMRAVSDDDVAAIIQALVQKAKSGDVAAAQTILDRLLGKPKVSVDVTKRDDTLAPALAELVNIFSRRPDLARLVHGAIPREIVAQMPADDDGDGDGETPR
jgi:hypothetical protein